MIPHYDGVGLQLSAPIRVLHPPGKNPDLRYHAFFEDMPTACAAADPECFCTAVGEGPHPEKGFDINVSPLPSGWLFETGSDRGEQALAKVGPLLTTASDDLVAARDARRQRMRETVTEQAGRHGLSPVACDERNRIQSRECVENAPAK